MLVSTGAPIYRRWETQQGRPRHGRPTLVPDGLFSSALPFSLRCHFYALCFLSALSIDQPRVGIRVERVNLSRLLASGTQCEIHAAVVGQDNVPELPDNALPSFIIQARVFVQEFFDLLGGQVLLLAECLSLNVPF